MVPDAGSAVPEEEGAGVMATTSEPSRRTSCSEGPGHEDVQRHVIRDRPAGVESVEPSVAARMSRQRRRDTAPEIALRRELHRRGLRFRVDHPLPGMPRRRGDVVFTRARLVVFVDGCFWHDCPDHGTRPATRTEWWVEKLARNVRRDRDTDSRLAVTGWSVLRFWEHVDPAAAADVVEAQYRDRSSRR